MSATRELPRTLLADDHLLVAEGLNRLLEEHCNVVATVANGNDLVTAAIEQVLSGGVYVSRPVAEQMGSLTAPEQAAVTLTARQRQVLQFIAKGYRMREIASALRLSRRTVEAHKYEIMRLLGFRNTADLVRYATWLGLIET